MLDEIQAFDKEDVKPLLIFFVILMIVCFSYYKFRFLAPFLKKGFIKIIFILVDIALVYFALALFRTISEITKNLNRGRFLWAGLSFFLPNAFLAYIWISGLLKKASPIFFFSLLLLAAFLYCLIPFIVLSFSRKLISMGLFWRCESCGALLKKASMAQWEVANLVMGGVARDLSTVKCGKCGKIYSMRDVYTGKYDY